MKKMLSLSDQINHLQNKGVKFEISSINDAKTMLSKINYFYKLTAYRKNFPKDDNGKYINLDFAYLTDLASIDMQLRDYLLDLSLDIEHGIKVMLLNFISSDKNEDGYSIVKDFAQEYPHHFKHLVDQFSKNKYQTDMYNKRHEEISIWVFLETCTFGMLSMFVDFYLKRTNIKKVRQVSKYLKFTKNIRNSCAHSNPLLVNLFSAEEFLRKPSRPVKVASDLMHINRDSLNDLKMNDLVSLFYLHKIFQSEKMSEHRIKQGKYLISRYNRHSQWYADNTKLNTFFSNLNLMIDYLNSEV